jgi:hypothetical protein
MLYNNIIITMRKEFYHYWKRSDAYDLTTDSSRRWNDRPNIIFWKAQNSKQLNNRLLSSTCRSFINEAERVLDPEYIPTEQDVLLSRNSTLATASELFHVNDSEAIRSVNIFFNFIYIIDSLILAGTVTNGSSGLNCSRPTLIWSCSYHRLDAMIWWWKKIRQWTNYMTLFHCSSSLSVIKR